MRLVSLLVVLADAADRTRARGFGGLLVTYGAALQSNKQQWKRMKLLKRKRVKKNRKK